MKRLLVLTLVFLSGCAHKEFIALPEPVKAQIQSTDVYVIDCPKKIQFDIENSHIAVYTLGGLMPALIDGMVESHRHSSGEKALCDVQSHFQSINVQEKFHQNLIPILKETDWLKTRQVHTIAQLEEKECKETCYKATSDAVLVVNFSYRLDPDFKTLTGKIFLTLYPASQNLKTLSQSTESRLNPLFKTHVMSAYSLETVGKDKEENAQLWAENENARLKVAFDVLIRNLMTSLKNVLKYPDHLPN